MSEEERRLSRKHLIAVALALDKIKTRETQHRTVLCLLG
jgi:hypothetical protein